MKKLKLKIICGFAEDQKHTIDIEEAHKAYYIFRNPEKRAVFANGVAIVGKLIQSIVPDWNATMDYNPTHKLDSDDWNEIDGSGVKKEMDHLMERAQTIALEGDKYPMALNMPLSALEKLIQEHGVIETAPVNALVDGLVEGSKI